MNMPLLQRHGLFAERLEEDAGTCHGWAHPMQSTDKHPLQEKPMNRVPDEELVLVPGGSLITPTPEAGRALAMKIARHTVHNIQPDLDILKGGRPSYSTNPESLMMATQIVAIEFQTIAAANLYWRANEQ
jgi:hypothetical protein